MWQEFATPAAALRYIKSEGAPSNLQQVQIERAAKNSKARNGFEFSFEAPIGGAAAKPPSKPTIGQQRKKRCYMSDTPSPIM